MQSKQFQTPPLSHHALSRYSAAVLVVLLVGCAAASPVATVGSPAQGPVINALSYSPQNGACKGDKVTFTAIAVDQLGGTLQYKWTATRGTLVTDTGQDAGWFAQKSDGSLDPGLATISLVVTDQAGVSTTAKVQILIDASGCVRDAQASPGPSTSAAPSVAGATPSTVVPSLDPRASMLPTPSPSSSSGPPATPPPPTVTTASNPTPSPSPTSTPTPIVSVSPTPSPTPTPSTAVTPTPSGSPTVATVASTGFQFVEQVGLIGRTLYVNDTNHNAIKAIDLANGNAVTTVLDGLNTPWSLNTSGSKVFVCNKGAGEVKIIDTAHGNTVTSVAVPGVYTAAGFGDVIYFADSFQSIKALDMAHGNQVTTVVSDASLNAPLSFVLNSGRLYFADFYNNAVKYVDLAGGNHIQTIASGSFNKPNAIALSGSHIYVADTYNNALKMIDMASGNTVSTLIGTGLVEPRGVDVDSSGVVYVGDGWNNDVKSYTP